MLRERIELSIVLIKSTTYVTFCNIVTAVEMTAHGHEVEVVALAEQCARISGRFGTPLQAVIPEDIGDPYTIIAQYAVTPLSHNNAMLFEIAPVCQRSFVAPERKGEELSGFLAALEPLRRDEAVDGLQ